jgi:asparagine synthase (glutamine-hydrolysing)
MCGIAGYINSSNPSPLVIENMINSIAHRGPDSLGFYINKEVALGHCRLSIIDLSPAANQPMHSKCGRYTMVFNGEIYNYKGIRSELELLGETFLTTSDTEVLLSSYIHWGSKMLDRLNGMWSFAIWDNNKKSLFLSRDRFGKKPFYYYQDGENFYFCSEIKGLLPFISELKPNKKIVADFAAKRISNHTTQTFFERIYQLPPGSHGTYCNGSLDIKIFWAPPIFESSNFCHREALNLLKSSVQLRLNSDVPIGILLSGGIDSSAITALSAIEMKPNAILNIFTTRVTPEQEETKGIGELAALYPNLKFHCDLMSAAEFLEDLDNCLIHQEEPFGDASIVAHFRLMRLAKNLNVKVLLTGQGADEIFAGYNNFITSYLIERLHKKQLIGFVRDSITCNHFGYPISWKAILSSLLPIRIRNYIKLKYLRKSIDWLADDYQEISKYAYYESDDQSNALNRSLLKSIQMNTLPGFLHYEDRNSMAFGIETRLPFLDYRIAEYILPIPSSLKLSRFFTKSILRKILEGIVPLKILIKKNKTGYPAPLQIWMREIPEDIWNTYIESIKKCPLIKFSVWNNYFQAYMSGNLKATSVVWRGLIISMWYKKFFHN